MPEISIPSAKFIIPTKSPLAITGALLCVLRERFADLPENDMPWKWVAGDAGRTASTIHIEAAKNPNTEEYGKRPGIYLSRGPITLSEPALANLDNHNPQIAKKIFYAIAHTSYTISCESELPAEAEQIASVVFDTMFMGADQIQTTFLFRKLGPFSLGPEGRTRQDTELSQVNVNMGLSYDVRWTTREIAPILKEVIVKLQESTYTDSDQFFTEIYQHSLADSLVPDNE